ncbi:hypothetical protein NA57DRAFT_71188 [Rhizodiscina lignyota]|uniref:Uncharacterized protein n=1 Tax=Rhizodiscina lignyota TaxID=1504668 RepID=A0A9P4ITE2_9PEZI|nr:hypothetical protein NA57DRAFT_71188 [Rhizodiscina lignyota]
MIFPLSSLSLALNSFLGVQDAEAAAEIARDNALRAQYLNKRQVPPPVVAPPPDARLTTTEASTITPSVLTYITPSPSAIPIPITAQSQVVQSFVPQVTFCAQPPLAYISGSFTNTATTGPYLNYSVSTPSGTGSCQTSQSPTEITVCATTLTALASQVTVTACDQNVTFSSEYGYALDTPALNSTILNATITPSPTIRTLTTYYIASWQDIAATPGVAPQDVDKKICSTYANGTDICVVEYEEWHVQIVTITTTTTSQIDVTATYPGPGQIIIHTAHWEVTDTLTTFALNSTMEIESYTETESTSQGPRGGVTSTLTVEYNTNTTSAEPTSTTTALITSTMYSGTATAVITPSMNMYG